MKQSIIVTLLLLLFALPLLVGATVPAPAEPCCEIVAIDTVKGIVTARDIKTRRTFKFEVDSRSLTRTLRVGQKVWVNAATRRVGFTDGEPCCGIIGNTNLDFADSRKESAVSTGPATSADSRADTDKTPVSSRVPWEIKSNADLKGSSGQIVIQFPEMTSGGSNEVAVFDTGGKEQITPTTFGSRSFPLIEGEYDVVINGVRLTRVPVKRGMDTRIHVGTIRFNTPGGTFVYVYDNTQKKQLCSWNGPMTCGLPAGEYYVKVGGSKKVTLADGQVIDF